MLVLFVFVFVGVLVRVYVLVCLYLLSSSGSVICAWLVSNHGVRARFAVNERS